MVLSLSTFDCFVFPFLIVITQAFIQTLIHAQKTEIEDISNNVMEKVLEDQSQKGKSGRKILKYSNVQIGKFKIKILIPNNQKKKLFAENSWRQQLPVIGDLSYFTKLSSSWQLQFAIELC